MLTRKRDALEQASATSILDHIAERLANNARSETIFGQPVENNGTTVVPVGKMRLGFGGGSGSGGNDGEQGEGSGGGGGVTMTPVGYIEITSEGSRFKSIGSMPRTIALVAAGVVAGAAVATVIKGMRDDG